MAHSTLARQIATCPACTSKGITCANGCLTKATSKWAKVAARLGAVDTVAKDAAEAEFRRLLRGTEGKTLFPAACPPGETSMETRVGELVSRTPAWAPILTENTTRAAALRTLVALMVVAFGYDLDRFNGGLPDLENGCPGQAFLVQWRALCRTGYRASRGSVEPRSRQTPLETNVVDAVVERWAAFEDLHAPRHPVWGACGDGLLYALTSYKEFKGCGHLMASSILGAIVRKLSPSRLDAEAPSRLDKGRRLHPRLPPRLEPQKIASVLNAGESDPFQPLCFQVIAEKERSAVEVKGEFCIKMGRDTYVVTQGESLLNRINTMGNVCRRRK